MMLLLTEAGAGIGFGHLTRMMAVGEALRAAGVETQMLVQWEGEPLSAILEGREWVHAGLWRNDPVEVLKQHRAPATLIDSYRLGLDGYASVAASGTKLAVIDDFYRLPYPADLAINPNVFGDAARYLASARQAVAGVEYVILRPALVRATRGFVVRDEMKRVLLTLGGSDVHQLGPKLATALAERGWAVNWIAPEQSGQPSVYSLVTVLGTQKADGMVSLVKASDLVVCGGGQTLHELACLGAPCVALELGDDQQLNLDFYERAGCLGSRLHWSSATLIEDTMRRVAALGPKAERARLAVLGRTLIDGAGAQRLALKLATLIK